MARHVSSAGIYISHNLVITDRTLHGKSPTNISAGKKTDLSYGHVSRYNDSINEMLQCRPQENRIRALPIKKWMVIIKDGTRQSVDDILDSTQNRI